MLSVLRSGVFGLCFLALLAVGCGSKGDGYSGPRGTVTGTITIDGKPLTEGCQVVFTSAKGFMATGKVDSAGKYSLSYSNGAVPAVEYGVQLSLPVTPAATSAEPADPSKMAEAMKIGRKGSAASPAAPFPARYLSASSSKMTFTVNEGDNVADFAITSK